MVHLRSTAPTQVEHFIHWAMLDDTVLFRLEKLTPCMHAHMHACMHAHTWGVAERLAMMLCAVRGLEGVPEADACASCISSAPFADPSIDKALWGVRGDTGRDAAAETLLVIPAAALGVGGSVYKSQVLYKHEMFDSLFLNFQVK